MARFTTSDHLDIDYTYLPSNKTCLVFVHPWMCNKTIWHGVIDSFKQHSVLILDLRGHGRSDIPHKQPYHITRFAQDVKELLSFLGIDECILIGFSLGGAIAVEFAATYPTHVRQLILLNPVLRSPVQTRLFSLMVRSIATLSSPFPKWRIYLDFDRYDYLLRIGIAQILANPINVWANSLDMILHMDVTSRLKKLHLPLTIIHGEHDTYNSPKQIRHLTANMSHVHIHVVSEARHHLLKHHKQWVIHLLCEALKEQKINLSTKKSSSTCASI